MEGRGGGGPGGGTCCRDDAPSLPDGLSTSTYLERVLSLPRLAMT